MMYESRCLARSQFGFFTFRRRAFSKNVRRISVQQSLIEDSISKLEGAERTGGDRHDRPQERKKIRSLRGSIDLSTRRRERLDAASAAATVFDAIFDLLSSVREDLRAKVARARREHESVRMPWTIFLGLASPCQGKSINNGATIGATRRRYDYAPSRVAHVSRVPPSQSSARRSNRSLNLAEASSRVFPLPRVSLRNSHREFPIDAHHVKKPVRIICPHRDASPARLRPCGYI